MIEDRRRSIVQEEIISRHQLERMVLKGNWDGIVCAIHDVNLHLRGEDAMFETRTQSSQNHIHLSTYPDNHKNIVEEVLEILKSGNVILELLEDEKDDKNAHELLSILITMAGKDLLMERHNFTCYGEEDSSGDECCGTLLQAALGFGSSAKAVSKLIEVGGRELVRAKAKDGRNAIHFACIYHASVTVVSELLEVGGVDILQEKYRHRSPLFFAIRHRYRSSVEVVSKLLEVGGLDLLLEKNKYGSNVLHEACVNNALIEIISELLSVGGRDVLEKNKSGRTPLHYACWADAPVEVISKLIDFGGRKLIYEKDGQGYNALHSALVESVSAEVVSKLLKVGGSDLVCDKDRTGRSPFDLFFENPDAPTEVLLILIEAGGRSFILEKDTKGRNTLSKFIKDGGTLRRQDKSKQKPLHPVLKNDDAFANILLKLIEIGGQDIVLDKDAKGRNILVYACHYNAPTEVITKLVEIGGKDLVLERDRNGRSPLFDKAMDDGDIIFQLLMRHGGEDILTDKDGSNRTLLQLLVRRDTSGIGQEEKRAMIEKISVLIDRGIQLNIGKEFGIGGLFSSTCSANEGELDGQDGQDETFDGWEELVLPALRQVMALPHNNDQPILQAAIMNKAPKHIIKGIMICCPQSVNTRDSFGRYALDVAVQYGLAWDGGMKELFEAFAFHWYRGR
mmetsp:Transcript_23396/g.34806  ORF Transcript_23396/g.34806 Transcript_23396/m.34806 type:complete len:679 (-) Transcript_23396:171-2207(-)